MTKRTIYIAGQKTSVSVDDAFWKGFKAIASERDAVRIGCFDQYGSQAHQSFIRHPSFRA
jgi:predicted DNA-binding ribbon-helix-helix protein